MNNDHCQKTYIINLCKKINYARDFCLLFVYRTKQDLVGVVITPRSHLGSRVWRSGAQPYNNNNNNNNPYMC